MQIYFTGLWHNGLFVACRSAGAAAAPQRWECVCRQRWRARPRTRTYRWLTNYATTIHPRRRQTAVQTQGLPVVDVQAALLVFNLSQWVRRRREKNSASTDCVCLTVKLMLCLGRLVFMKLFTISLFYPLQTFFQSRGMSECLRSNADL